LLTAQTWLFASEETSSDLGQLLHCGVEQTETIGWGLKNVSMKEFSSKMFIGPYLGAVFTAEKETK
jgi:hypothetical protein